MTSSLKITTETYKSMGGDMITRHYVNMGDDEVHVLNSQQLWQLVLLGVVELGKRIKESRVPDDEPA